MKRLEEKAHTSRMSIKKYTNHTHPEKISISLSRFAKLFYENPVFAIKKQILRSVCLICLVKKLPGRFVHLTKYVLTRHDLS